MIVAMFTFRLMLVFIRVLFVCVACGVTRTLRIGSPKLFTGWGGGLDHQPQQQPVNNFAAGVRSVTLSPVAVRT